MDWSHHKVPKYWAHPSQLSSNYTSSNRNRNFNSNTGRYQNETTYYVDSSPTRVDECYSVHSSPSRVDVDSSSSSVEVIAEYPWYKSSKELENNRKNVENDFGVEYADVKYVEMDSSVEYMDVDVEVPSGQSSQQNSNDTAFTAPVNMNRYFNSIPGTSQNKVYDVDSSSSSGVEGYFNSIPETSQNKVYDVDSSSSSGVEGYFNSIPGTSKNKVYDVDSSSSSRVEVFEEYLSLPVEHPADNSPDSTIISVASSLPPLVEFDNNTLRAELIKRGFRPGPIQDSTRTLYLKKLQALKKNPIVASSQGKTYSIELEKSLRTDEWMKNLTPYIELENKARSEFATANKNWREGNTKTSFTYLLLDPRLTDNLPTKAANQSSHANWVTFVNSIFYVGKGKRSRPYSHLYQALNLWKRNFTQSQDKKVQHILDIWSDKVGVVCLHIFQNVIPVEAYTYEAAMIDVLGLQNLKNLKCGNYYGAVQSWPHKDRRMLGQYLLFKAMNIFLSEGERQLRPEDID